FQWPLLEAVIEGNIVADFPLCRQLRNGSRGCTLRRNARLGRDREAEDHPGPPASRFQLCVEASGYTSAAIVWAEEFGDDIHKQSAR
ncbi:MAG: hypothetical protein WBW33_02655, partial [Bryobacteraceae bacterium]